MTKRVFVALAALLVAVPAGAQTPTNLAIKWVRDSREYQTLAEEIYGLATRSVEMRRDSVHGPWAVVLDVDETALDNSVYELERAAYHQPFDTASWNAWVRRAAAPPVPGVAAFVARVRALGGRVAWITDRDTSVDASTRENLRKDGLWSDGDALCAKTDEPHPPTKRARRQQLRFGVGPCGWPKTPVTVLAYVGDHMADLPDPGEDGGPTFAAKGFLLPDPMYGDWEARVPNQDLQWKH